MGGATVHTTLPEHEYQAFPVAPAPGRLLSDAVAAAIATQQQIAADEDLSYSTVTFGNGSGSGAGASTVAVMLQPRPRLAPGCPAAERC